MCIVAVRVHEEQRQSVLPAVGLASNISRVFVAQASDALRLDALRLDALRLDALRLPPPVCKHVCAQCTTGTLSICPKLKMLVTSRGRLHLSGKKEYQVSPMSELIVMMSVSTFPYIQ